MTKRKTRTNIGLDHTYVIGARRKSRRPVQRPDDEPELIRRAQQADREAFARLVDRYWGRVFHWLAEMIRDRQAAEDLVQECFLKAWRCIASCSSDRGFRP